MPVVGSLLAALLFRLDSGRWSARSSAKRCGVDRAGASLRIGHAAFWGRMVGTLAKVLIGAIMVGVVVAVMVLG